MAQPPDDSIFFDIIYEGDEPGNQPGETPEKPIDPKAFEAFVAKKYPEKSADDDDGSPLFDPENPDGVPDHDPLYDIACNILPKRALIRLTLDHIYDINFIGLVTAGIVEETCRGKLPDDQVDRLTCAALIAAAENRGEVVALLPAGTVTLAQKLVGFAADPAAKSGSALTLDETCLYESYLIAKLEVIHQGLQVGTGVEHDDIDLSRLAEVLSALSKIVPEDVSKKLATRACKSFNTVAADCDLGKQLQLTGDYKLNACPRKKTPFQPPPRP